MTEYTIKNTTQFKKVYKLAKRRNMNLDLLKDVITKLANGEQLEVKYRDHALLVVCRLLDILKGAGANGYICGFIHICNYALCGHNSCYHYF